MYIVTIFLALDYTFSLECLQNVTYKVNESYCVLARNEQRAYLNTLKHLTALMMTHLDSYSRLHINKCLLKINNRRSHSQLVSDTTCFIISKISKTVSQNYFLLSANWQLPVKLK